MEHKFAFPKKEHLYGKNAIDNLHKYGRSFVSFPMRVIYTMAPKTNVAVRCMMVAPKKKLRHAVCRVRARRLMREAYRKNKTPLVEALATKDFQLHISFIYMENSLQTYDFIEKKMISAIKKLTSMVEQDKIKQTTEVDGK